MLTTIKMWGPLADRFSPEIQADITTAREAISAVCANHPDFRHFLIENPCVIVVSKGDWERQITELSIDYPVSGATITFVPVAEGSGLLGGIPLTGIGIATGNLGFIIAGVAMGLQSIFFGNPEAKEEPASSYFQGGNYNVAEGSAIPIACGICMIKTPQVLSQKVTSVYEKL
jgi:predicted phage tail protein